MPRPANPFGSLPLKGLHLKVMALLHGEVRALGFELVWCGALRDEEGPGLRTTEFFVQPRSAMLTYAQIRGVFGLNSCFIGVHDPTAKPPKRSKGQFPEFAFSRVIKFAEPAKEFAEVVEEIRRVVGKNASILEAIASTAADDDG